MKEQTLLQSVRDPQELALVDLFDRLAELGSKVRRRTSTNESDPEEEQITQSTWEAVTSDSNPPQII